MIRLNEKRAALEIVIPISGLDELSQYQRGIMGLLRKIGVGDCDPTMNDILQSVDELLSPLVVDKSALLNDKELLACAREGKLKNVLVQS